MKTVSDFALMGVRTPTIVYNMPLHRVGCARNKPTSCGSYISTHRGKKGATLYSTIFFQRKSDKLYAIETAHKISRISILPVSEESTTYVMPCTSLYRCPGSPGPAQRQSLNDGCEPDLHSHRHSVVVAELAKAGCEGYG